MSSSRLTPILDTVFVPLTDLLTTILPVPVGSRPLPSGTEVLHSGTTVGMVFTAKYKSHEVKMGLAMDAAAGLRTARMMMGLAGPSDEEWESMDESAMDTLFQEVARCILEHISGSTDSRWTASDFEFLAADALGDVDSEGPWNTAASYEFHPEDADPFVLELYVGDGMDVALQPSGAESGQPRPESVDPGAIPFATDIVLWDGEITLGELKRLGEGSSLVLDRLVEGPALLRAGGRYVASGAVVREGEGYAFRVDRLLSGSVEDQALEEPELTGFTIVPKQG